MKIFSVGTVDFRNLQNRELSPGPGVNVFYGDNGQGKTNLLEAVWLMTGARSFRGAKEAEMTRTGCDGYGVNLRFFADEREQSLSLRSFERREYQEGGAGRRSPADVVGLFCAVVFSPQHLSLVCGGPQERRVFLDSAIGQCYPRYVRLLLDYRRALMQKNFALKSRECPSDRLDIWDVSLARAGAEIARHRAAYIGRLAARAADLYRAMAPRETLSLRYRASCYRDPDDATGPRAAEIFLEALASSRAADLRLRSATAGTHRDDLTISLSDMPARTHASQGQQRSAVLALKLAEAELLTEARGERPVILLDDVMSELDAARRDYLLHGFTGHQCLVTCCERELFRELQRGRVFRVRAGRITRSARSAKQM